MATSVTELKLRPPDVAAAFLSEPDTEDPLKHVIHFMLNRDCCEVPSCIG